MPLDFKNIGSTRTVQDPQAAVDALTGTYKDSAAALSDEQRLPLAALPRAPELVPFVIKGEGTGGR